MLSIILLKHVNETPTISKAKTELMVIDFRKPRMHCIVTNGGYFLFFSFFFFLMVFFLFYLKPQPGLFFTQFNFFQAVACESNLFQAVFVFLRVRLLCLFPLKDQQQLKR